MSDANIDIQASNLFDVGANFKPQPATSSSTSANVTTMDAYGNIVCERNIYDITSFTQSYQYCGSDFIGDFVDQRTAPVPFLENIGCVFGDKLVTSITVNMTAGEKCTVDFEGHNHNQNAHDAGETPTGASRADALALGIYDGSDALPHETGESFEAWDGFGINDFGMDMGDTASIASATVTWSITHEDRQDEFGKHLVGKNITPKIDFTFDFQGIPTSMTSDDEEVRAAAFEAEFVANTNAMYTPLVDSTDKNDSNTEFDSSALIAHAHTSLATV